MLRTRILDSLRGYLKREEEKRYGRINAEIAGDAQLTALFNAAVDDARGLRRDIDAARRRGRGNEYTAVPWPWAEGLLIADAADAAARDRAVAWVVTMRKAVAPVSWFTSVPTTAQCLQGMQEDFSAARRAVAATPQP